MPPTIHAALRSEVERLGRELRSRGVFARTLSLRLRFPDGRVDSRTLPLSEATALDDVLLAGAMELLGRLWAGDRLIRAVGVSCAGLLAGTGAPALFPVQRPPTKSISCASGWLRSGRSPRRKNDGRRHRDVPGDQTPRGPIPPSGSASSSTRTRGVSTAWPAA